MNSALKYGMRPPSSPLVSQGTDVIGLAENGALLARAADFDPAFFDLKTKMAGEIFQKASNYFVRLAIVLDGRPLSDRFKELIHDHRRHTLVRFFHEEDAAAAWLTEEG